MLIAKINFILWNSSIQKSKILLKKEKKKINILYLDHSAKHGIDKIKVVNDLNILKKHEEINITIRPNTSVGL